jgi:hypothetical protein
VIGIECKQNSEICGYYVCFDNKSEFIYLATTNVEAISLSKRFLRGEIFKKYPKIAEKIMIGARSRYMKNIKNVLQEQRLKHMKEVNIQSRYKTFNIEDKGIMDEKKAQLMR